MERLIKSLSILFYACIHKSLYIVQSAVFEEGNYIRLIWTKKIVRIKIFTRFLAITANAIYSLSAAMNTL